MNKEPSAEAVSRIAQAIARCDFRVTMSRYMLGSRPWIITVGESSWSCHIIVDQANAEGTDANLAILRPEQSKNFGYDIDCTAVAARMSLKQLIARRYTGMKEVLCPMVTETS